MIYNAISRILTAYAKCLFCNLSQYIYYSTQREDPNFTTPTCTFERCNIVNGLFKFEVIQHLKLQAESSMHPTQFVAKPIPEESTFTPNPKRSTTKIESGIYHTPNPTRGKSKIVGGICLPPNPIRSSAVNLNSPFVYFAFAF